MAISEKFKPGDRVINTLQGSRFFGQIGTVKETRPARIMNPWQYCYIPLVAVIDLDSGERITVGEQFWYKTNK